MTGRGRESVFPNRGTETRASLLREAAVENIRQWACKSNAPNTSVFGEWRTG